MTALHLTLAGALAVINSDTMDQGHILLAWQTVADKLAADPGCLDQVPLGVEIELTATRLIIVGAIRMPGHLCPTCPACPGRPQ